jgi:hypothetical protein
VLFACRKDRILADSRTHSGEGIIAALNSTGLEVRPVRSGTALCKATARLHKS